MAVIVDYYKSLTLRLRWDGPLDLASSSVRQDLPKLQILSIPK